MTTGGKHKDRIYFRCSDELVIKGKEVCAAIGGDWNDAIRYLVMNAARPGLKQRKYKCHFDHARDSFLECSVTENTWIEFKTFAAVFTTDRDAFDYLVYNNTVRNKTVLDSRLSHPTLGEDRP